MRLEVGRHVPVPSGQAALAGGEQTAHHGCALERQVWWSRGPALPPGVPVAHCSCVEGWVPLLPSGALQSPLAQTSCQVSWEVPQRSAYCQGWIPTSYLLLVSLVFIFVSKAWHVWLSLPHKPQEQQALGSWAWGLDMPRELILSQEKPLSLGAKEKEAEW